MDTVISVCVCACIRSISIISINNLHGYHTTNVHRTYKIMFSLFKVILQNLCQI